MRLRYLLLPLVAIAGAAVALLPSLATGSSAASSASFTASDFAWKVSGSSSTQATISQGGTVNFSYPSGTSQHNADFGSGPHPSSCTQTAGANSGPVPPLPNQAAGPGWSGSCTFNTPGTYTFHCDLHPFMTGTIVVQGSGTTTSGTTTGGTTSTSGTPTSIGKPPKHPAGGSPLAGAASSAIAIAASQRGATVRGSVKVSSAGAGGRLEVDLSAARRALGGSGRGSGLVGRLVHTGLHAGKVPFSVGLDAAGKRALARHGQLPLSVTVKVVSRRGVHASLTRRVVERAAHAR